MKLVIRTGLFHILCILIFAFIYFYFKDNFQHDKKEDLEFLDYIFLSSNIQSSVGMSDIYPNSSYGKFLIIIQQIVMIMTYIFTFYIFTL
jgi:hypothetical protein